MDLLNLRQRRRGPTTKFTVKTNKLRMLHSYNDRVTCSIDGNKCKYDIGVTEMNLDSSAVDIEVRFTRLPQRTKNLRLSTISHASPSPRASYQIWCTVHPKTRLIHSQWRV